MAPTPDWLTSSLIHLGAAVLAVPVARLLGLGSIVGQLAAGIAVGPWGLALVTDVQTMLHVAEFGVVLMHQMAPHQGDANKLIAMAKQGRTQLESLWAQERQAQAAEAARDGASPAQRESASR